MQEGVGPHGAVRQRSEVFCTNAASSVDCLSGHSQRNFNLGGEGHPVEKSCCRFVFRPLRPRPLQHLLQNEATVKGLSGILGRLEGLNNQ